MKAGDKNVLEFIGSNNHKVFIIPPFQRNYEWTAEQCDHRREDLLPLVKKLYRNTYLN